jgi:SSS family solute:Na+ symporter
MVVLSILWLPFISRLSSQLYIYLQSVQGYISPPIAACFMLGILWPRLNGSGAISSLLTGFVLGAVRFVAEVLHPAGGQHYGSGFMEWLVHMNFLHYAILMFVVCSLVLVAVSLATPAPEPWRVAGMTFATVDMKVDTVPVDVAPPAPKPAPETRREHTLNVIFSLVLIATVVGLWIHFR